MADADHDLQGINKNNNNNGTCINQIINTYIKW